MINYQAIGLKKPGQPMKGLLDELDTGLCRHSDFHDEIFHLYSLGEILIKDVVFFS
jgi:hypothetical protein